jgi:hypothetical protein
MSREEQRRVLSEIGENAVAILLISLIGAVLFILCGGSLDGLMYGKWTPVNDHPTNWDSR